MNALNTLFPESDDLAEIMSAPVDAARAAQAQAAAEQKIGFIENCPSCRGTGSWRGRGRCFKCQGKGKLTFKTSPEQRAANRESAKRREERERDENLAQFTKDFPAEAAYLIAAAARGFNVAADILENGVKKYGTLSEGRMAALRRFMHQDAAREEARIASQLQAKPVTTEAIEAAFSRAAAILKYPRLTLTGLAFTRAGAESKNPGALYVKERADGVYLGKIMGGKFQRAYACTDAQEQRVLEVCADPKGAAERYGHLTGHCAICSRLLTNAESTARGIGPICAENFGW